MARQKKISVSDLLGGAKAEDDRFSKETGKEAAAVAAAQLARAAAQDAAVKSAAYTRAAGILEDAGIE